MLERVCGVITLPMLVLAVNRVSILGQNYCIKRLETNQMGCESDSYF
jgi:hypothetical protein